jgi:hypothetical protein
VTYFSFLDGNTLAGGSENAVKDSIDTSAGKMDSVKKRQNLSQTYDSLDKDSLLILLLDSTPNMRSEMSKSSSGPFNTTALSHMKCMGISLLKQANNINIKMLLTADDAESANDISDGFDNMLSLIKDSPLVQSGSTLEKVLKKVKLDTNESAVTVTLSTTYSQLTDLRDEFSAPSSD